MDIRKRLERTTSNCSSHSATERAGSGQTDQGVQFEASSLLDPPRSSPHPSNKKKRPGPSVLTCNPRGRHDSLNPNHPGRLLADIPWLPTWSESSCLPLRGPCRTQAAAGTPGGQRGGSEGPSRLTEKSERTALGRAPRAVGRTTEPSLRDGWGEASGPRAEETLREVLTRPLAQVS